MKMQHSRRHILEAIKYWKKQLDESVDSTSMVTKVSLDDIVSDSSVFD